MEMEAGELDTRLTLRIKSSKKDEYGDTQDSWQDVGTYWGSLKTITNRNANIAKGFAATVNYESKLRYCPAATNDCEVLAHGTTYYVNGVMHDPRKRWTMLFLTVEQG
jgi:SPP1 family predicted phage head-tail adaptor